MELQNDGKLCNEALQMEGFVVYYHRLTQYIQKYIK